MVCWRDMMIPCFEASESQVLLWLKSTNQKLQRHLGICPLTDRIESVFMAGGPIYCDLCAVGENMEQIRPASVVG